jgi:beta-aspartyl-peptidase (threonine type)
MIIVHGGAGNWKDERIPVGIKHVEKAAIAGFKVLEAGNSALDAAEVCTSYMESCGQLNAGRGARPNLDGELELDALIIDGSKLDFGAVGAVTGIVNPVSLARYVMEKTDYKFFVGINAKRVYDQMVAEGYRGEIAEGDLQPAYAPSGDTVGCLVVDSEGNIAATSSTGGISKKQPGRVGDSPVMGAGAFANENCGASATGWGEHIMRVVLSRMTVLYVEEGFDVTAAAHKGIKMFEEKTGSEAGIIVADRSGNYGFSHNAKAMPLAVISRELKNMTSHACRE